MMDQTFLSASYRLTLDYFDNRPGDKLLDSQVISQRASGLHALTKETTLDVSDAFVVGFEIPGRPSTACRSIPTSHSDSNEANARFNTTLSAQDRAYHQRRVRCSTAISTRSWAPVSITRKIFTGSRRTTPSSRISGAISSTGMRRSITRTRAATRTRPPISLLVGGDYDVGEKITASGRFGVEYRKRDEERNATSPYVEISSKYAYAQGSFLAAGYVYTFEEPRTSSSTPTPR